MSIIGFFILVTLLGLGLYLVNKYVPMEASIKKILNIAIVVFIIIIAIWFLLGLFNISSSEIFGSLGRVRGR